MIYLITGLPGAGKTLNTIKEVYEKHTAEGCSEPKDVYVYGIKELNVPEWIEIDIDRLKDYWESIPSDSVIIVDEVQDVWPTRSSSKPMPEEVKRLAQNRHRGLDLYFTCQNSKQIDIGIRDVTSYHIHYYRPFGLGATNRYYYEGVVSNPLSKQNTKFAQHKIVKFNKKYYDFYKSADSHTVKRKLPLMVYMVIPVLLYVAYSTFLFFTSFDEPSTVESKSQQSKVSKNKSVAAPFSRNEYDYVELSKPRYPSLPDSAPAYDDINKNIKSKPRLQFVVHEREGQRVCFAYTQQATRVNLTNDQCLNYMDNGRPFDPTLEDYAIKKSSARTEGASALRGSRRTLIESNANSQVDTRFRTVPYSGVRPSYPTSDNSYKGIF